MSQLILMARRLTSSEPSLSLHFARPPRLRSDRPISSRDALDREWCLMSSQFMPIHPPHISALSIRRPDDPHMEQHLAQLYRHPYWPLTLCHVRPVSSKGRSHRVDIHGPDRTRLGHIRFAKEHSQHWSEQFRNVRHVLDRKVCPRGP